MLRLAGNVAWFGRTLLRSPSNYYAVLYGARSFNLPPDSPKPHYDWVSWLRRSGQVPNDAEIHTGPLRESKRLADAYFFLPQMLGDRPSWTYLAERLGSRIVMTFYSHNFQTQFHPPAFPPIYKRAEWPEAVVMTEQCETILRQAGARIGKCIVDPSVSTLDSGARITLPQKPLVAICDIDPPQNYNRPAPYHSEDVVLKFLSQASAAVVSLGAVPVWKPKGALRSQDSLVEGDIRKNADEYLRIAERYGAILCPSGTPIGWLADNVDCAVVLPFTSAATTFRHKGRQAVYYDPTASVANEIVTARGHSIISNYEDLRSWLTSALHIKVRHEVHC